MLFNFQALIHILFPPSPDEVTLAKVKESQFFPSLQSNRAVTTLLPYRDPAIQAALHLAKFHHHTRATALLGYALAHYYRRFPFDIIIPIPLSSRRYRQRGYNQVVEIIRAAQKFEPNIRYNENLLYRTRHTTPQTELDRTARLRNVESAFSIKEGDIYSSLAQQRLILLDDVSTTGATLKAARVALEPLHLPELRLIALAG